METTLPRTLSTLISTSSERQEWRTRHLHSTLPIITDVPKVELHIHIEGTLSPSLRWKLSRKHSVPIAKGAAKIPLTSLSAVQEAYSQIRGRIGAASAEGRECFTFFEIYYGGFELLGDEEDYYELAVQYFERAAKMGVRYCEVFFDPQGHTRRGIAMDVIMGGFRRAQNYAEKHLNVRSQWIMCILRDMSPESAMEQYEAALHYKDMIVGIGLDSDELDRPPKLFEALFKRARADGFKITSHCDFNQKNTHEHIRQVAEDLGGTGANRIDHGMNAADRDELMTVIREKGIGMTICPCAYIRHTSESEVFPRIRKLFDAGIKITIASDDPAYMEDNWVLHNLYLVREKCEFTDREMVQLQRNAIHICWASDVVREELSRNLDEFERNYLKS
ncbi:adenosine deaminase [Cadophora sp. DSE1049]|nr:adenosine deaminase [Cadophora sp. DSE1049]